MDLGSNMDNKSGVASLSDAAGGPQQQDCQHDNGGSPAYICTIPAPDSQLAILQAQLPLELVILNNECEKIQLNQKLIIINEKMHMQQNEENLTIRLKKNGHNDICLKLATCQFICFKNCKNIRSLDISHTFVRHLDTRQLLGLEELRLMNTNVRRLNLANQANLGVLHCNYTLLDYTDFSGLPELEELRVDALEYLKSNRIAPGSEVFVDGSQTVDSYQVKALRDDRMGSYIVSYPQMGDNEHQIKIVLSKYCNELFDKKIKQCKQLAIDNLNQQERSIIDLFEIVNYPVLEEFIIWKMDCQQFYIANLPSLISIKICNSRIYDVYIIGFSNLQKIKMTECKTLEQLNVANCENVNELDIRNSKISKIDVRRLKKLKLFSVHGAIITKINVANNTKLEQLDVGDTKIMYLDLRNNTELQVLYAQQTDLTYVDLSNNIQLRELDFNNSQHLKLNISRLVELNILSATNTAISQLYVSTNTKLQELDVSDTKISFLNLKQLEKLNKLWIHKTNIKQIDLLSNKQLTEVWTSRNCKIMHCHCQIYIWD